MIRDTFVSRPGRLMGLEVFGLVCGCGGALAALLVAASLLRLAVSATNKLVGPAAAKAQPAGRIAEWDWDDWDDQYAAPVRPRRPERVIPEPGLPKCALIVLTTFVIFGLGFFVLGIAAEEVIGLRMWREDSKLLVAIFNLPVGCLALTVLLIGMLPTTFWRAAMVTFLYGLILFAFLVLTGVFVYAAVLVLR